MRELFRDGAGIEVDQVAFLTEGDEPGIIDSLALDSNEWQWANAVLGFMRALYGILEAAEGEIVEEEL